MRSNKSNKLSLRTTTLRPLAASALSSIAGGTVVDEPTSYDCQTTSGGGDGGGGKSHVILCISQKSCISIDKCFVPA